MKSTRKYILLMLIFEMSKILSKNKFFWLILFPIIIILFSSNAISAEREQGTLKMLLVAGISKFDLLKAKFQAIYKGN